MGPYKVKRVILTNAIKLELPSSIKIHPVINISRVQKYRDQVEGQKKKQPLPVIIEEEEEYKVEKILNKRKFRERDRYLIQWKGYTIEEDTWKPRENLENVQELVDRFEGEYREEARRIKKRNLKEDCKGELPGRYTAKLLYRWDNKKFNREYWGRLERNWKQWRSERAKGREILETIQEKDKEEKEENEQEFKGDRIKE